MHGTNAQHDELLAHDGVVLHFTARAITEDKHCHWANVFGLGFHFGLGLFIFRLLSSFAGGESLLSFFVGRIAHAAVVNDDDLRWLLYRRHYDLWLSDGADGW